MGALSSFDFIIAAAVIVILSFWFNGLAKKTNIPSVLMLIVLGIIVQYAWRQFVGPIPDFTGSLEILGTVGLIMIVLEAALELELKREKLVPILKAVAIALIGLIGSAWVAALIIYQFIPEMTMQSAWLYATPLSILSSAIIIPSVGGLQEDKKEFHIYESTFSDIMGIMMFYFLAADFDPAQSGGVVGFAGNIVLTIVIALVAGYAIILVFQKIKSSAKLFLLISILLLLYAIGKKMHLSPLIIILVFGLIIKNIKLFFPGKTAIFLDKERIHQMYHELHIITLETAFVVRTFFFVIFGITIVIASLFSLNVALISVLIIASIYIIRFVLLRVFIGKDFLPQLFIAPRGLITVLLFYGIPAGAQIESFESGVLLFVIIATSLIMTGAMIKDKRKMGTLLDELDEEVLARNEAEDALHEKNKGKKLDKVAEDTPKIEKIEKGIEEDTKALEEEPRTHNLSNDTELEGSEEGEMP